MSGKKYVVPERMVDAAHATATTGRLRGNLMLIETRAILESAIRWLAEHPIVPTAEWIIQHTREGEEDYRGVFSEWQKVMFIAPEPEVPDAVKDLLWARRRINPIVDDAPENLLEMHDKWIMEAYRRGKAGK